VRRKRLEEIRQIAAGGAEQKEREQIQASSAERQVI
jgi:hypothetical protein